MSSSKYAITCGDNIEIFTSSNLHRSESHQSTLQASFLQKQLYLEKDLVKLNIWDTVSSVFNHPSVVATVNPCTRLTLSTDTYRPAKRSSMHWAPSITGERMAPS